jgi:nitroimidazol reductase NimA-like FMN-containing flavoprotein (pyridoxamine 5'-phosphate oxidase superfamily)
MEIIGSCTVCRLGMAKDNMPYIVPMSFGFTIEKDLLTLYFHCANEGMKLEFLKSNPLVCFEMDVFGKFTAGESACSGGMSYQSVIGFGKAEFVTDPKEKNEALLSILYHYTGKRDHEISKDALNKTEVFKVISNEFTGKQGRR